MNFETAIIWLGKFYKILEKFNLQNRLEIDNFVDTNYPQVLSRLQTYSKYEKIALCATNGKRTTIDFLNQILVADNKSIITNVSKEAKIYPVLTSIILDLSKGFEVFGKNCIKDYYTMIFEENELATYFNSIKFDYLLLHNLFVDQKNSATLKEQRDNIQKAIVLNSKLKLVINADEPLFYRIDDIKNDSLVNKKRYKLYYGFEEIENFENGEKIIQKNDILRCPKCSCKLDFDKRYYSHIGSYNCSCGFRRPELDIKGYAKIFSDYIFLTVVYKETKLVFKLPFGGVYNAYNALGAIAMALALDIDRKTISKAIEEYEPIKARDEIIEHKGKSIKIKEIKNPTSLSEAICELYGQTNIKVVFCLNDDYIDGHDTSWIWDSNFEVFKNFNNKIYLCGNRFDDMALRLKYCGVNPCYLTMDQSIKNSIECCFWELEKNEKIVIFSTPSALNEIYNVVKKA